MTAPSSTKKLSAGQRDALLDRLQTRFAKHRRRHPDLTWDQVRASLEVRAEKLWSLHLMEETGGEPDVVGRDERTGEFLFVDCSPESPKGRTGLCYDHEALESRKEHKPPDSAMNMAAAMGVALLDETQYRHLQTLGAFDTKSSSWIATPADIRQRGGALFCDRRYDHVFTYHNGAQSYYAGRGFRGRLKV